MGTILAGCSSGNSLYLPLGFRCTEAITEQAAAGFCSSRIFCEMLRRYGGLSRYCYQHLLAREKDTSSAVPYAAVKAIGRYYLRQALQRLRTWEAVRAVVEISPAVQIQHAHLRARHHFAAALHYRHRQQLIVSVIL